MTVNVDCSECGHQFEVPRSLKGGIANCPACEKAVPVAGGPEPLFWVLLGGAVVAACAISGSVFLAAGAGAGLVTGAVLLAVIIGVVLLQ